jgi:hypothetical protein
MGKRSWLAVLLGALGMFVWNSLAHLALPLGEAGVREIQNEQPLLSAMRTTLPPASALYLFPAKDPGASMADYGQKLVSNPSGVLMYNPPGSSAMAGRMVATEFVVELLEVLIAVFLLSRSRVAGFAGAFTFFAVLGVAVSMWTNLSYWNWYGFPSSYTAAYMFTQFVGFLVAGLIVAALKIAPRAAVIETVPSRRAI